jgi:hypothetical protein
MTNPRYYHSMSRYNGTGARLELSKKEDTIGKEEMLNTLENTMSTLQNQTLELITNRLIISGFIRNKLSDYILYIFPHGQTQKMVSQRLSVLRNETDIIHLLRYAILEKNNQGYKIQAADPLILKTLDQQNP